MKICRTCRAEKPEVQFPKRGDGKLRNACKTCHANHWLLKHSPNRERYQSNGVPERPEQSRTKRIYMAGRRMPGGMPQHKKGPQGLLDTRPGKRRWTRENPEKRAAHKAVEYALKRGELTRQSCERCGAAKTHAHHDDYSKPLAVMWLCPPCHATRHDEIGRPMGGRAMSKNLKPTHASP